MPIKKKQKQKKCLHCGDTVTTNGKYCSAECKEEHEQDLDELDDDIIDNDFIEPPELW